MGNEACATKEEIQDRYNRLLWGRVQEISDVKTLAIKGQTQPVLVEGFDEKGDGLLTGRRPSNDVACSISLGVRRWLERY